jgi:hypothetical protein
MRGETKRKEGEQTPFGRKKMTKIGFEGVKIEKDSHLWLEKNRVGAYGE